MRRTGIPLLLGFLPLIGSSLVFPVRDVLGASIDLPERVQGIANTVQALKGQLRLAEPGGRLDSIRKKLGIGVPIEILESSDVINAFSSQDSAGHSHIVLTSALLSLLGDSDGEIACVIGHEAGHLIARYNPKGREDFKAFLYRFWDYPSYQFPPPPPLHGAVGPAGTYKSWLQGSMKAYRVEEYYADITGIRLAQKAGFNPYACMGVMGKFMGLRPKAGVKARIGNLWEDHPLDDNRIQFFRQYLMYQSQKP